MDNSRKKILFINSFFGVGGIQTSLINMSNELCNEYQIDFLIYHPEGPLKDRLDPRVNIIQPSWALRALGMSVREALKSKNLLIILFKILGSVWTRIFDNRLPIWIATKLQPKLTGYDLAIAFRPETRKKMLCSGFVRVLCRCTEAKTKIAWIHYDAKTLDNDREFNAKYYAPVDKIVGVSASVAKIFASVHPELREKTDYCYNFFEYEKIIEKSKQKQETEFPENKMICFSACRFSVGKGIVRGVKAFAPVFREHEDILWYIAGDGPERENIEAAIREEKLENRIILLGSQSNPYNYMKNSDLLIIISYHEAAPMVYKEAKALHVPVFSTNTSSSFEMLKDGTEDFICENSEEGIRAKFSEIMNDREKICNSQKALEGYRGNNNEAFDKFTEWVN